MSGHCNDGEGPLGLAKGSPNLGHIQCIQGWHDDEHGVGVGCVASLGCALPKCRAMVMDEKKQREEKLKETTAISCEKIGSAHCSILFC